MIGTIAIVHRGHVAAPLVQWLTEHAPAQWAVVWEEGREIARQRNRTMARMQGDWVLCLDSDCVPPADAVARLLAYETPLIGGMILERRPPFELCAVKTFEPTVRWQLQDVLLMTGSEKPRARSLLATGTGCLLIHRSVLDTVPAPWFRCGQLVVDCLAEDTDFCLRAAERGFIPRLATDVLVGHAVGGIVWPEESGPAAQWNGVPWREPLLVPVS